MGSMIGLSILLTASLDLCWSHSAISLFLNRPSKDYPQLVVCSSHSSSIRLSWAIHTYHKFSLKSALFISSVARTSDGWTVLWNNCVLVPVQSTHTFLAYKDWTAFSLLVRDPVVDDWKAVNSSRITAAIRKPLLTLAPAALLWAETRVMDDAYLLLKWHVREDPKYLKNKFWLFQAAY